MRVGRRGMAFQPERSRRFFTLEVELSEELPLSGMDCVIIETIVEEQGRHL